MRKPSLFFRGPLFPFVLAAAGLFLLGVYLSVRLPFLLKPIAAAERLFALFAVLTVAADGSPAEYKLPKAVLVLLLPWVGATLCFVFLFRGGESDFEATMSEPLPADFSSLPPSGGAFVRRGDVLKTAEYFPVGREMYLRLLGDLKGAKRSVWLEFYIIAEGVFFGDVLGILTEKAARGVDVRLIYDGFGCALTLPPSFEKDMRRRGIRTRCFRPLRPFARKAGRRDHRKIVVIDGEIGYTGGINLADEYIGEKIRFGHWKDSAIRVTGGAASSLARLFCRSWNAEGDDPLSPPPPSGGNIPCAVISDTDGGPRAGRQALLRLIAGAKRRLYLNTPYLAPDTAVFSALAGAALGGVDVRLMIPHIPDKKFPFLLTRSYARELERCGVQVMEYTDGFLHAKSVVADGVAFVSSYNLDFRSLYLQSECGVAVKSPTLADKLAADFLAAWAGGTPLPAAGRAKEFFCRILRLTAPLI